MWIKNRQKKIDKIILINENIWPYGGHNRQKGHSDSGVLLCIVSKNYWGNNNDDVEDYQLYGICERTFHCIHCTEYLQFGNIILACMISY